MFDPWRTDNEYLTLVLVWVVSSMSSRALASSSMIMCTYWTWLIHGISQKLVRTMFMIRNNVMAEKNIWQPNLKKSQLADLVPSAMIARWNRVQHFLLGENWLSPLIALQPAILLVHLKALNSINILHFTSSPWHRGDQHHSHLKKQLQAWIFYSKTSPVWRLEPPDCSNSSMHLTTNINKGPGLQFFMPSVAGKTRCVCNRQQSRWTAGQRRHAVDCGECVCTQRRSRPHLTPTLPTCLSDISLLLSVISMGVP